MTGICVLLQGKVIYNGLLSGVLDQLPLRRASLGLCVLVFPQRDFGTNPSGIEGPQQSKQRFMSLTFGPTKCSGVVIAHIYELWVYRLKNTKNCFYGNNCDWMIGLQLPSVPRCYKNILSAG